MIKARTVFALGAGASNPYGFPLGRKLLFEVCDCLARPTGNARNFIKQYHTKSDSDIDCFINELRGSHIASVDAFLENRPEYLDICKPAIAVALIPHERFDALVREPDKYEWYEYLLQQMGSTRESFRESAENLSFVTFNYDRSLEYFLFYSLANAYGQKDAVDLFNRVTIVHVYGELGSPDFLNKDGRGYAPDLLSDQDIEKCAINIKIMPERSEDSTEFKQAHRLISEAQSIHFLGFGYDEKNVQRLKVKELFRGVRMQGTLLGLGISERARVFGLFDRKWNGPGNEPYTSYDVLSYLKNIWNI